MCLPKHESEKVFSQDQKCALASFLLMLFSLFCDQTNSAMTFIMMSLEDGIFVQRAHLSWANVRTKNSIEKYRKGNMSSLNVMEGGTTESFKS